jgi:spore germination cell wall hydrolase CwlJ-like protein
LLSLFKTRADARALAVAVTLGLSTGAAVGGAYLLGGLASAADQHARFSRLADTAARGFSESALTQTAVDSGVLAIARRLDPMAPPAPESPTYDRQVAQLNERLQRRLDRKGAVLLRASLNGPYNPAAAPFHYPGALEGSRELDCLTQAVYYEARGETPGGQAAVAQVVINRARNPRFPQSICGVVFQRAASGRSCQFSFACDGSTLKAREPRAWRRAQTIASRALDGYVMAEVGSATHFHTTNVSPAWGPKLMRVAQVGMHVFYKFGGRAGSPGAFTSPVEFAVNEMPVEPNETPAINPVSAVIEAVPPAILAGGAGGMGGPVQTPVEPASAPAKAPAPSKVSEKLEPSAAAKISAS